MTKIDRTCGIKFNEPVNGHLLFHHIEVVEPIDRQVGRITLCTERELKERKANKKKTILFSPSFHHTDVRERRIAIFVVYSSLVRSVIFHFSIHNIQFPTEQNNVHDNSIHRNCLIVLFVILFVF